MKQDRFFLVILGAIGVLIVVAVGLFFARGGTTDYIAEDKPQDIIHNYIVALEKEDYQRAYGYLREAADKPDFDHFRQAFLTGQLNPTSTALQIGDSRQSGEDMLVSLVVIYGSRGPFGDIHRESSSALLVKGETGEWKIANLPYPYWGWDWYQKSSESLKAVPSELRPTD